MPLNPLKNPVIKTKMSYFDMGLEIVSIVLALTLWLYQVYIQNMIGSYYFISDSILQSSRSLYIVPSCGTLLFILCAIISAHPENLPQVVSTRLNNGQGQMVYSNFLKMISFSKINGLAFLNVVNYVQSQQALGNSEELTSKSMFIGMQIFIVLIYLLSILIIYINDLSKQILPNQENNQTVEVSNLKSQND